MDRNHGNNLAAIDERIALLRNNAANFGADSARYCELVALLAGLQSERLSLLGIGGCIVSVTR